MRAGAIVRIPEAVASRAAGRIKIQPGLPGRWSVWSQASGTPGAHFLVPADDDARATGVKYATVRITEPAGETARIQLLETDPVKAMPKARTERAS